MIYNRWRVTVACLAVLILGTFAASVNAAQITPDATPPVTLELWTWAMRPWFNDYMSDLIAAFQSGNPGVQVHWVDVPADTIVRKYFAAGAAGRLPDVVNLPDKNFLRFAGLGGLLPLDHILPGDPNPVYVAPALDQCKVGGQLFALPWYLSTEIAIVNPPLLASGGLSSATLATHWDQLLEQAGPFHQKTGKYLFMPRLGESDLLNLIISQGYSSIKSLPGGGYTSNLMDPQVISEIEKWVDACRTGIIPRDSATAGYPETVAAFKEQRTALLNADAVRSLKNDSPRLYQQIEVRPGITGRIDKTNISVVEIAVGSQTIHPALAAKLAWFMTSAPWQERLCRQASRVPGTRQSLLLPEFCLPNPLDDKLKAALKIECQQLIENRARSFIPPTGEWPDMELIFNDEMKRSMLEGVPVKTSLERINRRWNQLLAAEALQIKEAINQN